MSCVTESEADAEKTCKMNTEEVQYGFTPKTKQLNSHMHRFSDKKKFPPLPDHKKIDSLKFTKQQWKLRKKDIYKRRRALLASGKLASYMAKKSSCSTNSKGDSPSVEESVVQEANVNDDGGDHSDIEEGDPNNISDTERELDESDLVTANEVGTAEISDANIEKSLGLQEENKTQMVESDASMEIGAQANPNSAETVSGEVCADSEVKGLYDANATSMLSQTMNNKICSDGSESMPVDVKNCTDIVDSKVKKNRSRETENPSDDANSGDEENVPNCCDNDTRDEHNLEVEASENTMEVEASNCSENADSRYEKCISGLIENGDNGADSRDENCMSDEASHHGRNAGNDSGNENCLLEEATHHRNIAHNDSGDEECMPDEATNHNEIADNDSGDECMPDEAVHNNGSADNDSGDERSIPIETVNCSDSVNNGDEKSMEVEVSGDVMDSVQANDVHVNNLSDTIKYEMGESDLSVKKEESRRNAKGQKKEIKRESGVNDSDKNIEKLSDICNSEIVEKRDISVTNNESSQEYSVKEFSVSIDASHDNTKRDMQELPDKKIGTHNKADVSVLKEDTENMHKPKRGRPRKVRSSLASETDNNSNSEVYNKLQRDNITENSISAVEDVKSMRRSRRGGTKDDESVASNHETVKSDATVQFISDVNTTSTGEENTSVSKENEKNPCKLEKDTAEKGKSDVDCSNSESDDMNWTSEKLLHGSSSLENKKAVGSDLNTVSDFSQVAMSGSNSEKTSGDSRASEEKVSEGTVVTSQNNDSTIQHIQSRKKSLTKVRISLTKCKIPPTAKVIGKSTPPVIADKSTVEATKEGQLQGDESNDMKTPTRTPRRKILKRPFSPTETLRSSTPDNAQPSSAEKAQSSSTGKVQPVKTPTSSKRAKNYCPEAVIKPFSLGWMREVVHRATAVKSGKGIDIYYFTPEGTKLRSMPEVTKYLSEHKGSRLTIENFTFYKDTIYRHPFEKERGARVKHSDGTVEISPVPVSASKNEKPKAESKPAALPVESKRKSLTADTKRKSQIADAKEEAQVTDAKPKPQSGNLKNKSQIPDVKKEKKEASSSDVKTKSQAVNLRNRSQSTDTKDKFQTEVSDIKRRSQTSDCSGTSNKDKDSNREKDKIKEPPKIVQKSTHKSSKDVTDQPTRESSEKKSTIQNSGAPSEDIDNDVKKVRVSNTSTEKRVRKTPIRFLDEKPAASIKKARVKYTESKKAAFRLPRPCTSRCLVALHEEPTVQCAVCLCMFHRQCVPEVKKSNTFVCKPCARSCLDKDEGRVSPDDILDSSYTDCISLPSLQPEVSLHLWPNAQSEGKDVFPDDSYLAQLPPPPPLQKAPERHMPKSIVPVIEGHPSVVHSPLVSMSCSSDVVNSCNVTQTPVSRLLVNQAYINACESSAVAVAQPACTTCVMETAEPSSVLQSTPPFTLSPLTASATTQLQMNIQPKVTCDLPVQSVLRTTLTQPVSHLMNSPAKGATNSATSVPIAPRYSATCMQRYGRYPVTCAPSVSHYPVVLTSGNSSRYSANKVTYRVFVPPQSCIPVSDILRPLSTGRSHVGGMRPVFAIVKSGSEHRLMASQATPPTVSQSVSPKQASTVLNSTVSTTPMTDSQITKTSTPKTESPTKTTSAVPSTSGSTRSLRPRVETPRKRLRLSSDSSDSDFDSDSFSETRHSCDSSDSESKKKKCKKSKTSETTAAKDIPDKTEVNGGKQKRQSTASSKGNVSSSLEDTEESSAKSSKAVSCSISESPLVLGHPNLNTFTIGYDCLNLILKKLKTSDLLQAAQVSRSWNYLTAQRFLWDKVSFQGLTILDWTRCTEALKRHGTRTLNLRGIQLDEEKDIWKDFTKNLDNLTAIEHLIFGQVPPSVLESVADKLPLLQSLECYCLTTTYKRPDLWSTICKLRFFNLRFLRKLRRLKIRSAGGLISDTEPTEMKHLPNLQHLSLTSLKEFPSSHFRFILHLPNLVSLELGDCSSWSNEIYEALGKLTKLRQLRLENGGGFNIALAASLCRMRKLEELELMKFKIPKNLGAALETLTDLTKLSLWPDNSDEAAKVNYNAFRAASRVKSVLYFCWGIISPDDCIPLLPIWKEPPEDEDLDEDEEEETVEEVHYEDLFERLCAAMPDSKVEMKCISEDFLNEYCSIQR